MTANKPIRAYDEFTTNISGLPEGEYLTQTLYSDQSAWKVIGRTETTLTLQEVLVERDPSWKPEFVPGGFAAHCTNQDDQKWIYAGMGANTTKVRLVKSRYYGSDKLWRSAQAGEFIANGACRKYDYNF